MIALLDKYSRKLSAQGICEPGVPLLAGLDARLVWNRNDPATDVLGEVIESLNITSLLFAPPAEPYFSILNRHAAIALERNEPIRPEDTETRTFLHDIPVLDSFGPAAMIKVLKRRKSLFVKDRGIITYGTVTPEQAFITFSSVCFSAYVKYFADHYYARGAGGTGELALNALRSYKEYLLRESANWSLPEGPYHDRGGILDAIASAGRLTVGLRLVDSFFGNISYRTDDEIYISQTGSSLDELPGFIDRCPMDGSSCAGVTASSEFSAHREVYLRTDNRAILHGHPKFSVIMSMLCDKDNCANRGICYKACSEPRRIGDIPVVPGEVGTGRYGLCNTMPAAVTGNRGAIVFGHGLFTVGKKGFREAFARLLDIELMCVGEFEKLL